MRVSKVKRERVYSRVNDLVRAVIQVSSEHLSQPLQIQMEEATYS